MNFAYNPEKEYYYLGTEPYTEHTYQQWVDSAPRVVAIDAETISLKERIAIGISIASSPTCAFYFPLFPKESQAVPWHMLKDPAVENVYHGGMFDIACMLEYDIKHNIHDTNIMARLLCHASSSLVDLGIQYRLEVPGTKDLLAERKVKSMLDIPTEVVARHCMLHGLATYRLFQIFFPQMDHEYYNAERATIPVMQAMSLPGIQIDQEWREFMQVQLEADVETYKQSCEEIASFNPGSPQQVSYVLAERGAYSVFSRLPFTRGPNGRPTGNLSSAVEVLEKMDDPLAQMILMYRQKTKLLGTYIKPWANEERARTRYHLDAITGRPSSTDRNMQNIPGKYGRTGERNAYNCRGILLPDSGVWTDLDFSQVEPRALCYMSGDKEMQYIFSQPKFLPNGDPNPEADIHGQVATFMDVPRKLGKVINLAMTYGATDETLMETAKIRDKGRASELRLMWGRKFPQAMDWIISTQDQALRTRRVRSAFGRVMRLPDVGMDSPAAVKRKAVDWPCQSTAADVLKRGLVALSGMELRLQIHDEFLIDGMHTEDKFDMLRCVGPFETPFEISYYSRWE